MTTFATIDIANLKVTFHATSDDAMAVSDQRDHYAATCQEDLLDLSGPVMVALYNATAADLDTNITPVNKFSSKEVVAKRLWANLEDLKEVHAQREAELEKARRDAAKGPANKEAWEQRKAKLAADAQEAIRAHDAEEDAAEEADRTAASKARDRAQPAKATDYPAPAKAPRRNTGINLAPKATVYACKEGTKQALMVDLLSRPEGATMEELSAALSGGNKPWQEVTVKSGLNWDMNKIKGYGIKTTKRGDVDCYHLVLPAGMTAPVPHTPRGKKA